MRQALLGLIGGVAAVQLPNGRFEGLHDTNYSTTVYYGIPYATSQRFAAPVPVADGNGTHNATTHGPACINFGLPPPFDTGFGPLVGDQPLEPQSEDCLTLDVYVPDGNHCDLPVLFQTPGGGFLVGASFVYDMRPLVQRSAQMGKPFIGITINYRLGPLGFLNPSSGDTNVGFLDQLEALRYVRKNVHAFGGDPDKMTIMGESAGAASTMLQLLQEVPVRGAWMASVPSTFAPFTSTKPKDKDDLIQTYAEACGCPKSKSVQANVACLAETDTTKLVNQSAAWEGSSVGFAGVIKENVFQELHRNKSMPPVVVSMCRDEGTSSAIGFKPADDNTTSIAIEMLANANPPAFDKFLKDMLEAYPNDPAVGCPYDGKNTTYNQPAQFKRMSAIFTDTTYTQAWTEYLTAFRDVWGILWEEPIPDTAPEYGVQHGSDLPYYFPLLNGPDKDPRAHGYAALVEAIQSALIRFVVDVSPGHWPKGGGQVMSLSRAAVKPVPVPHRPGFDVLRDYLRPKGFYS